MDDFLSLLNKVHDLLVKNADVADIFNIDDDKKTDDAFFAHEAFHSIDWRRVSEAFVTTVNYLMDYAYKNDNVGRDGTGLAESVCSLHATLSNILLSDRLSSFTLNQKLLLLKTHVLLLMFSVSATITKDISSLIKDDLSLSKKPLEDVFYRGHSDEKFKLIPSIFRSFNSSKYGNKMTFPVLYDLYKETGLLTKYDNIFASKSVDGEFCAFMQHSCAYSPFLDLTKNHIIALSFATSNHGNLNDYSQKKSAIFEFRFNRAVLRDEPDLRGLWVYFSKDRLRYFSFYKTDFIFYFAPSYFDPVVCLLTNKTNDRMKYQDGAFLFFQSCVVVNGHILMPYRIGKIIKYTISPSKKIKLNKMDIYQEIVDNHRKYDDEHLMDPYLYFSEVSK